MKIANSYIYWSSNINIMVLHPIWIIIIILTGSLIWILTKWKFRDIQNSSFVKKKKSIEIASSKTVDL